MLCRRSHCALAALIVAVCFAGRAAALLDIQVNYSGDPQYQPAFNAAAAQWESLLVGYQNGLIQGVSLGSSYVGVPQNTPLTQVYINASVSPIDGPLGILGSAGPDEIVLDAADYILTSDGSMTFDSADIGLLTSGGDFLTVVLHEMAHVLGFGTLWTLNGVYDQTNSPGQFLGPNAAAAWQSEFGQAGPPAVEVGGGAGTAHGHWNENDGGAGLTGITDSLGRDMRNELMTGWLNSGGAFISQMTVNSFIDIGFIGSTIAVPETSAFFFGGVAATAFGLAQRRRRSVPRKD